MIGNTYIIATAMRTKLCSKSDAADQEEEGVEAFERKRENWMKSEAVVHGYKDEVDERQHGEDGDKDAVVDDGRVSVKSIVDDVSC